MLFTRIFSFLFGSGRNVIRETAEVFIPNAEADAQRGADMRGQAMSQYQAEFGQAGVINQIADGLNRMGRPIITYGVISLFVMAMIDPTWFAARMQGLALIPEPLWVIFGAIVSFFFGARELSKFRSASMAKEAARIHAAVPLVIENSREIEQLEDAREEPRKAVMSNEEFEEAMSSTDPMTNEVILEWNRRNQRR